MSPDTDWLDDQVRQVRDEAGKMGISQEEVVARLRAGETVGGLFPALAAVCQGRISAYLTWELQTHSWDAPSSWPNRLALHAKSIGLTPGKLGSRHVVIVGEPGSGMGWVPISKEVE